MSPRAPRLPGRGRSRIGIKTTVPLHRRIMDHPDFVAGTFSTKWMETFMEELKRDTAGDPR